MVIDDELSDYEDIKIDDVEEVMVLDSEDDDNDYTESDWEHWNPAFDLNDSDNVRCDSLSCDRCLLVLTVG